MLNEEEYQFVMSFLAAPGEAPLHERQQAVLAAYAQITGRREVSFAALQHHRLALYGSSCPYCGKPLRTPRAVLCGSCMHAVPVPSSRIN